MTTKLHFKAVLTPQGVRERTTIIVNPQGVIDGFEPYPGHDFTADVAIPGVPNAHSHAFQRAMAGLTERAQENSTFWGWRDTMYRVAQRLTPDDMRVVAEVAFRDMLAAGYTSVAEFHYIHRLPDGTLSADMAQALWSAAQAAGIRMVLFPVIYQQAGIGKPPLDAQKRFVLSTDEYLELYRDCAEMGPVGCAPHSLRAVGLDALMSVVATLWQENPATRFHIHIGEQPREIEEIQAATGYRPYDLLARCVDLGNAWVLVHATHFTEPEFRAVAATGATLCVCPLTEAHLGDGTFRGTSFWEAGGKVAIGSDSNARLDAFEEIRWLDYAQRLRHESRSPFALSPSRGAGLFKNVLEAGALALGAPVGRLEVGAHADIIALADPYGEFTAGPAVLADRLLVSAGREQISGVFVGGKRVALNPEAALRQAYQRVLLRLVEEV
jgi:formimidoylglutamate deiminase